jgi:hypothetical protein
MQEVAQSALAAWENFYIIVGSSAAALTGLQFVVVTLVMESRMGTNPTTIGAFATPTIVHFCIALLVSAALSAPWPDLFWAGFVVAACGAVGLFYSSLVVWRATRQTSYKMVAEDWTWHVVFPLASYVVLLAAGVLLAHYSLISLFAVAAATLLLVYIGIHNAWDTTTYVAALAKKPTEGDATAPSSEPPTATPAPSATAGS